MQQPLEDLLAHLRTAIDAAEDGADNKDELARLAGEVERRLNEDDQEGLVEDLREEVTRFEASAEIQMRRGPKPADEPRAFDARSVMATLGPQIQRPAP